MTTSFMLLVPLLYIFLWLLAYMLMQDKINHETTGTSIPKITPEELNLELRHPSPLECIYSCDQTQRELCSTAVIQRNLISALCALLEYRTYMPPRWG